VEYYNRPIGFFERLRQVEETAEQILWMDGPVSYLTTSDAYDAVVSDTFEESSEGAGSDRTAMRSVAEQVMGIQAARKRMYTMRRPTIISIISASAVKRFIENGVAAGVAVSDRVRAACRKVAAAEVENIASLMEAEPMGLQFGLLSGAEPTSAFGILRARDRASLAVNPFRPDTLPSAPTGVAMITGADEAIAAHQRVAEACWREAVKGPAGAAKLRQLIGSNQE
jgi:hypothetical protein